MEKTKQYPLTELVPGQIWLKKYPVSFMGFQLTSRMTVIRLKNGNLLLHSPGPMDEPLKNELNALGDVAAIIAPNNFHYFHIQSAQKAFPDAKTYVCPGVQKKQPELDYDGFLTDAPFSLWAEELDQVLLHGHSFLKEAAFFHIPSRTLILVDLFCCYREQDSEDLGRMTKVGLKALNMWEQPTSSPEFALLSRHKAAFAIDLKKIMTWPFERVVPGHGQVIEENARETLETAWKSFLEPQEVVSSQFSKPLRPKKNVLIGLGVGLVLAMGALLLGRKK